MPAQNEKPIIFSGPMVRAILDGRKTQTRRAVKPQPLNEYGECSYARLCGPEWYEPTAVGRDGEELPGKPIFGIYSEDGEWGCKCPYEPGMKLWLRETWQQDPGGDHAVCYKATGHDTRCVITSHLWRPSIFMPRSASRVTLEITEVRVERLNEISREDAIAEGAFEASDDDKQQAARVALSEGRKSVGPVDYFRELWDSINGKSHPWSSNPWVWAIRFKTTS